MIIHIPVWLLWTGGGVGAVIILFFAFVGAAFIYAMLK